MQREESTHTKKKKEEAKLETINMSLPKASVFNLKNTAYHLCVRDNNEVWFEKNDEGVFNGAAKFVIVSAVDAFHIRSVYNNKYLVQEGSSNYVNASSVDPVEDTSNPNCTLFTTEDGEDGSVWLKHVASGKYLDNASSSPQPNEPYRVTLNQSKVILVTAVDMTRLIKLPKTTVLKADTGKYLCYDDEKTKYYTYNQIFENTDRNDKATWYETSYNPLGKVRFFSVKLDRFCCMDTNFDAFNVSPNYDPHDATIDELFEVVQVSNNSICVIDFRGKFCKRESIVQILDIYSGKASSAVAESIVQVDEPVIRRTVNIEYRLKDGVIYNLTPKSWHSATTENNVDEPVTATLTVSYTKTKSYTISASASLTTSASATFEGGIPVIFEFGFEVSVGFTIEGSFGHTWDNSESSSYEVQVTVPGHSKRAARVIAMEGNCDVPFSYVQTDVLADNTTVNFPLTDGVFLGLNGYGYTGQVYDPDNPTEVLQSFSI